MLNNRLYRCTLIACLFLNYSCAYLKNSQLGDENFSDQKNLRNLISSASKAGRSGYTPIKIYGPEKNKVVRKKKQSKRIESKKVKTSSKKNFQPNYYRNEIKEKISFFNVKEIRHELVDKWIYHYSVVDRERFQRSLNRGELYKEVVQNILEENGLPKELYYLAMIESGFVINAKSSANAVGFWQFIKGTGKQYGLHIDYYVDERKDPIRATHAAAKYLRKLYHAYESWELAMAAYNSGEYRVLSAVMKGETRDYWSLINRKYLPKETRNYVPKLVAAISIATNLKKYGFTINKIDISSKYPDLVSVEVPSPSTFKEISSKVGVSVEVLKKYNPHLSRDTTPLSFSRYEVWFPEEAVAFAKRHAHKIKKTKKINRYASGGVDERNYYLVKKGDSLYEISLKFNVPIKQLRTLNNLTSTKIKIGQRLRVPQKLNVSSGFQKNYRVKKGDSLSSISEKFNVQIVNLKRYNNLRDNKIFVGQYMRLKDNLNNKKNYHFVKKGENLTYIARKYGLAVSTLRKKNRISGNFIYPGQKLKL